MAKQVTTAPLIIDARIRKADRLKPEESPGLAADTARFLVEADVSALIRGTQAMASRITYTADVPLNARGKPPKLAKQRVLLFARPVPGRPGMVQLTGLQSQMNWLPELDAQVRAITRDALAADAPPAITGVGNAFHVPGSLPGEGETQVFLQTASGAPVSLQILRRPGEATRWSVSLGDIVDESAGAPNSNTFLWYRLACGLPRSLPADSVESDDAQNAAKAREDYQFVLRSLGPCT
ncbi:MAG: hypothetical protein IIZ38_12235 [Sphingomonas sp.]|uniref:hypothetical protein n=1 Tax=Sphingomonas sp. TaxID=28214 RepID=UPI0025F8727B|nr:hypothetical protein [Sphingomonas sp.]MBQ1499074.1 hypothetical protein [Sphingomonas sp.]